MRIDGLRAPDRNLQRIDRLVEPAAALMDSSDEQVMRRLFEVVQSIAGETERTTGAAAVLTNLGEYQDSKHLHIHVHSGARR